MPIKRSYADHGDACAAAHGFELLGEVWTYPIVRELLLGPKRFAELKAQVRGITPAVLSTRLRQLTARGLVKKVTLPPPARAAAYELTDWGKELDPVVQRIAQWAHHSPTWQFDGGLTPDGVVLAMKAMASGGLKRPLSLQLELNDERLERPDWYVYRLDWDAVAMQVARGAHPSPAAVVRSDSTAWARVVFAGGNMDAVAVSGDPDAVRRLVRQFLRT